MTKAIYDTDDDGVVDNSEQLNGHGETYYRNQYVLTCPTTGYTSESVDVWGTTKTLYAIILTTDKDGATLDNFASGMKADYPMNVDATLDEFKKLYALAIGDQAVTLYFTEVPSTSFHVLVKESI